MTTASVESCDLREARMSFGEHLEELRRRLVRALCVLGATSFAAFFFHQELLEMMLLPYQEAMDLLGIEGKVITTDLAAGAMGTLKLVFIVGIFAASPYLARQLWGFVGAGLYEREKKYIRLFAPASFLLFVGGCLFGYFYLVPYSLYGLARFLNPEVVSPTVDVAKYLGPDGGPEGRSEAEATQIELESLLDLAQPGWRKVVAERRFLPNLTVVNALATAEQGGLAGRPGPEIAGAPGLYVAGDWVGPEGWLVDATLASAKSAAAAIIQSDSLTRQRPAANGEARAAMAARAK